MTKQIALEIITNIVQRQNVTKENDLALAITQKAIEKQIPKKPDKRKEHKQNDYYCAVCRHYLGDEMELKFACLKPKFCPNCGQALDWSDEE